MIDGETRRYAAMLGQRYFEGTVTFEALMEQLGDSEDPLIQAFLFAVLHEPSKGFLSFSKRRWERTYRLPVSGLLEEMEKGEAGVVPQERVYPKVGVWSIVGWAMFALFAGASALESVMLLWKALAGAVSFPWWPAAFRSLQFTIMAAACWRSVRLVIYRWHLRSNKN